MPRMNQANTTNRKTPMPRRFIGALIVAAALSTLSGCATNDPDFGRANAEGTNFVFLTTEPEMVALACDIIESKTLTQLDAGSISSFGGHLSNFIDGAVPLSMDGGSGIVSVADAEAVAPRYQQLGYDATVATFTENVVLPKTIADRLNVICESEDIHALD